MNNEEIEHDVVLYGHKLPPPDPSFCSHCRKAIISGQHNVVKVEKAPEVIRDLDGKEIGKKGATHVKAYFHASCFQEIADNRHLPGRVECKYCGTLSLAHKLEDGRSITDICKCSCHRGKPYCSLLI